MLTVGNIKSIDLELGKPNQADPANIDIRIQLVFKIFFRLITDELLRRTGLEQQK